MTWSYSGLAHGQAWVNVCKTVALSQTALVAVVAGKARSYEPWWCMM